MTNLYLWGSSISKAAKLQLSKFDAVVKITYEPWEGNRVGEARAPQKGTLPPFPNGAKGVYGSV